MGGKCAEFGVGCAAANLLRLTAFLRRMENLGAYGGAGPPLCLGSSAGGTSSDLGRGVEALWSRFSDRDRGRSGCLSSLSGRRFPAENAPSAVSVGKPPLFGD